MWVTSTALFLILCPLVLNGVSDADNCRETTEEILAFPEEPFTFPFHGDGVKDISLVSDGTEIARIEGGNFTIIDNNYKDKLSSKGLSFYLNKGLEKGQYNFTVNILYENNSSCLHHYHVTVDDPICGETQVIKHPASDSYIILRYETREVKEIKWLNSSYWPIGVIKPPKNVYILDHNYLGKFSMDNCSLLIHNATTKDHGNYTAMVSFQNGTRCLQCYEVTRQDISVHQPLSSYYNQLLWIILGLLVLCFIVALGLFLWKRLKKKCKQNQTENVSKENGMSDQDNLPPERVCLVRAQKNSETGEMVCTVDFADTREAPVKC